jgi:23S rRNA (guanosine2251-2'-O)-methyltransferase
VTESRVITGPRFVTEALRGRDARSVEVVYAERPEDPSLIDVRGLVNRLGIRMEAAPRARLDALAAGTRHQGIIAIAGAYPFVELETLLEGERPFLVALDEISDPYNFGAIVRSAVAFGVTGILVPKHRNAPISGVVVRASAGATEHARIAQVTNLQRTLHKLADAGMQIVGLDGEGDVAISELPRADLGRVLVIGSEGDGMRRMVRERCTVLARIPHAGVVESLNASVAAAIALYEASRTP